MENLNITPTAPKQVVEVREYPAHMLPDLRLPIRKRTLKDVPSFIRYVNAWGESDFTVVYHNEEGVKAVLNEEQNESSASLTFTRPIQAERWLNILNKGMGHETFIKFLEERHVEITDAYGLNIGADFFTAISNFQISTSINYDAKKSDDKNYTVAFTLETGGGSVAKLPKKIYITVPLIEGEANLYTLPLAFNFTVPKSEGEKPSFSLACDTLKEVFRQAAMDVGESLKKALPDYLVVYGSTGS